MVKAYEESGRGDEEDEEDEEDLEMEEVGEDEVGEGAVEAEEPGARTRRMKRSAARAGTRARMEDLALVPKGMKEV